MDGNFEPLCVCESVKLLALAVVTLGLVLRTAFAHKRACADLLPFAAMTDLSADIASSIRVNRLIAAGKVTFEGKARGTKYSLAK